MLGDVKGCYRMLKDAKGGNAKGILPRARAWPPARPPSASGGASGTENFLKSPKNKILD